MSAKAPRRAWLGLAVLGLPAMLYAMDLTALDIALPRISAALHPSSAQLLWIADIYGFMLAGMLIPMGTLGDRIGRRKLLLIGAAAFGLGSILASAAKTAEMLIATRACSGLLVRPSRRRRFRSCGRCSPISASEWSRSASG
jgi:DHA2 family multidrug resistance protein-like MFS transporter